MQRRCKKKSHNVCHSLLCVNVKRRQSRSLAECCSRAKPQPRHPPPVDSRSVGDVRPHRSCWASGPSGPLSRAAFMLRTLWDFIDVDVIIGAAFSSVLSALQNAAPPRLYLANSWLSLRCSPSPEHLKGPSTKKRSAAHIYTACDMRSHGVGARLPQGLIL